MFRYPGHESDSTLDTTINKEKDLDYEFYRQELAENNPEFQEMVSSLNMNIEDVKGKYEQELEEAKKTIESEMNKQKQEYELRIKDLLINFKHIAAQSKVKSQSRRNSKQSAISNHSLTIQENISRSNSHSQSSEQAEEDLLAHYMNELEKEQALQDKLFEEQRKSILQMERKLKRRKRFKSILKKKVIHLNLMIEESNLIARELKRKVVF